MDRNEMVKDLTVSQVDRQNILNNEMAIMEIQKNSKIDCIIFEDKYYFTKSMTALLDGTYETDEALKLEIYNAINY